MTQTAIQQAIHQLFGGRSLSAEQAEGAMTEIMQGEAGPRQVPGAEVCLCQGSGGVFSSQVTNILGTAATI